MRVRRHPALWGGVAVLCIGVVWLAWSLLPGMAAGWVFATLETEWGVVGRAGQVDLDLVSLEVRVRDLTLAAAGTETQPFLTAEAVTLTLPWSAVFGAPAVDRLDIVAPVVSVRQGDDGTSNLPVLPPREASSDSPGEPLRLGVITVHRASVSWLDEARGLGVVADPVELQLQPVDGDQSQTTGLLTLSTPTRITWGARETAIGPVSARLTAGPSGITVRDVVVTAPEARLALDGEVAFGVPGTQLRFEYGLDLDLGQVVPWLEGAPPIRGAVRIAGRLAGTPAAPVVEARLEAEQIAWADLAARGVTATARVADGRVTVDEFGASLAGGTVEGAGAVTLTGDGTRGEISLSWAGLSADLLSAATWPTRPVAIASSLTGVAAASWTGSDPRDVVVTLNSGHRALPGAALRVCRLRVSGGS